MATSGGVEPPAMSMRNPFFEAWYARASRLAPFNDSGPFTWPLAEWEAEHRLATSCATIERLSVDLTACHWVGNPRKAEL